MNDVSHFFKLTLTIKYMSQNMTSDSQICCQLEIQSLLYSSPDDYLTIVDKSSQDSVFNNLLVSVCDMQCCYSD